MSNADTTIPMPPPPISSLSDSKPQETQLRRGAFEPPVVPGTLGKLERFDILRLLGEGGMGEVYLAREPRTDTPVAVKIMKPGLAGDPQSVHRFLTEARHMYRLSHPRILRVLEVSDRKEGPYYVMPYIEGGCLQGLYGPDHPLPTARVLAVTRQVAEALAYAHSHGIIHRDLKPGNVLLDGEGNAYLTDFGLVRTVFNDSMVDASSSHLEGTAPYMSPAVARGEAEDTRCDIYAFGALLYELLAGQPPYTGRTPQIILDQVLKGPPTPIRTVNSKASPALVRIAEGCMARELRDRYASMTDIVADLERIEQGKVPRGVHGGRGVFRAGKRFWVAAGLAALLGGILFGVARVAGGRASADRPASLDRAAPLFSCVTNNGAVTVTGYLGAETAVAIPDGIGGLPVTGIADQAFKSCTILKEIVVPASVATVGREAFAGCVNLESAFFKGDAPGGGSYASLFESDTKATVYYSPETKGWLGSYGGRPAFPREGDFVCAKTNGVAMIAKYIGEGRDVSIPETIGGAPVTQIGRNAFIGCPRLTRVVIPAQVSEIGFAAFFGCGSLTSVVVRSRQLHIGNQSFAQCNALTHMDIPEGVTNIEIGAFWNCGFECVSLPSSVAQIGANPWSGCRRLASIDIHAGNPRFTSIDGVLFDRTMTNIVSYPCRKAGRYAIPDGVASIGPWAFGGASELSAVMMPNTVTAIGFQAFIGCSKLTSIRMPKHVAHLEDEVFRDCHSLSNVFFAGSAPLLGNNIFMDVPNVVAHYLPGSAGWGKECCGRPTVVWNLEDPFDFTTDGKAATIIQYKGTDEDVTIPLQLKGLPVETIADNAFADRTDIVRVSVSDSVKRIGNGAFRNCPRLTEVAFGDNVASIGGGAFSTCANLAAVRLPASVRDIGGDAFRGCSRLPAIRVDEANPAYWSSEDGILFSRDKTRLIRYPETKAGPYSIPSNVVTVCGGAFAENGKLTAVVIPHGVTSIEGYAFWNCAALSEARLPASVNALAGNAFGHCERLAAIHVDGANAAFCSSPDGVVFNKDRTTLVSYPSGRRGAYVAPDGVRHIGFGSFQDSMGVTEVLLPDSVTSIDQWTFLGSDNLVSITIPAGVTYIDYCTFWHCDNLEDVRFKGDAPKYHENWGYTFGLTKATIYHRPDAKGWCKEFSGRPTAVWVPEANGRATNLFSAAFVESTAERRGDWEAALLEYENRYDSQANDEYMRSTLRKKFAELRPKAARNSDSAEAGVWKVKAYAFRELDFKWTDNLKAEHRAHWKMRDDEITTIRKSLEAFAAVVWDNTSGSLRVDWTLEVIDKPLTKLDGGDKFWPSPSTVAPFLPAQKQGEVDEVMVYVKTRGGKGESGEEVPSTAPFGHVPPARELGDAAYANFKIGGCEYPLSAPGEAELHEWLHLAQWTLEDHQRYPYGLLASPDFGRDEGELGGDYCYRRKQGEKGWLDYYRHLMRDHVTRKMWRELSVRQVPDNVWLRQYAGEALVLGPFDAKGSANLGLDVPFIDETNATAQAGLLAAGREWKKLQAASSDKRILLIDTVLCTPITSVCYVAVYVFSDKDQPAQVKIGSDNNSKLFLNGQAVLPVTQLGSIVVDQCATNVNLLQGLNQFVLKVGNNYGSWMTSFRLAAPDGGPLATASYVSDEAVRSSVFYSCITNNDAVTITEYTGPGGAVAVPNVVNGLPVIAIGDNAFDNRTDITAVTLPDGLTSIGAWAFFGCEALAGVTVPEGVKTIGDYAFRRSGLTGMTLPNSATELGKGLFFDCAKLEHANLPDKLGTLPWGLFLRCASLVELTLPSAVTRVSGQAFSGCGNLTKVTFRGDVPEGAADMSIFADSPKATVYRRPKAKGWGKHFGGKPVADEPAAMTDRQKPNFSGNWRFRRAPNSGIPETYTITHQGENIRLTIKVEDASNPRVLDFSGQTDGLEHRVTIRGNPARLFASWQKNDLVLHTIREEPAGNEINVKRVLTLSPDGNAIAESRYNPDGSLSSTNILDKQ